MEMKSPHVVGHDELLKNQRSEKEKCSALREVLFHFVYMDMEYCVTM